MPIFWMPIASRTSRVRSMSVLRPTVARQLGPACSPTLTPLPAARMRARVSMRRMERPLLAAGGGADRGPDGLGPERQLIDGVLRLDEQRLAALVAQDPLHGSRDH